MTGNILKRVSVDLAMGLTLSFSMLSGLVLWLVLPKGRGSSLALFLGLTKHAWESLHNYVSLLFGLVILLHLALNAKLFSSMVKRIVNRGKTREP